MEKVNYAVIQIKGKQYKVKKGQLLTTDYLAQEENSLLNVNDVLLLVTENKVLIGQPKVEGASVKLRIGKDLRGKKIYVEKYKAKSRYHRRTGHRQSLTQFQVEEIIAPKSI
jgi:large subunit ribosomal protein L21